MTSFIVLRDFRPDMPAWTPNLTLRTEVSAAKACESIEGVRRDEIIVSSRSLVAHELLDREV
jgi:hypothetical protein